MSRCLVYFFGVAAAVVSAGCCVDPVNGSRYFCFGDVSDDEEVAMGTEFAPSFLAEGGGRYPDPALHAFLGDIVIERMARRSQRPGLPWEFEILNTSDLNAFALPGGKVFVTRGLLSLLETEAQFATLMGHEVGHVTHRHALRGQGRNAILGVLVGTIALAESAIPLRDRDDPLWIAGMAGSLGTVAGLKFSRDQELESDERGVDYASLAGYDPNEGTKTFATFIELKERAGETESSIAGLLSTHPLDSDRIEAMKRYIAETQPAAAGDRTVSRPEWKEHIERLKKAQVVYRQYEDAMKRVARARVEKKAALFDEAETMLRDCMKQLPDHAPFPVGIALIALARETPGDALQHLDRAVTLDPRHFEAHFLRGIARDKLKRSDDARADLERAHEIHPMSPFPCLLLGDLHEKGRNFREAASWFQKALDRSPPGSDVRKVARARLEGVGRSPA